MFLQSATQAYPEKIFRVLPTLTRSRNYDVPVGPDALATTELMGQTRGSGSKAKFYLPKKTRERYAFMLARQLFVNKITEQVKTVLLITISRNNDSLNYFYCMLTL